MRRLARHLFTLCSAVTVLLLCGCEIIAVPVIGAVTKIDAAASNGNFDLRGVVIDGEGHPLHGVKMNVEAWRYLGFDHDPPGGGGVETKKRTKRWATTVDGSFELKTGRHGRLWVCFSKPGHESRCLIFDVDSGGAAKHTVAHDREYFSGPSPLRLSDIRVALPERTGPDARR